MHNVIVTGGYGFIGSNFINYLLRKNVKSFSPTYITNIDKVSEQSDPRNLIYSNVIGGDIFTNSYHFDLSNPIYINSLVEFFDKLKPSHIYHFAAESHVDRSIDTPIPFIQNNINSTLYLLEAVRKANHKPIFVNISTDEVYGSLGLGDSIPWEETTQYHPNSPYSASKAAAEHMVTSYGKTYGLKYISVNCCNNYGPNQNKEKFIPKIITNALTGQPIPVYGDGLNVREWIHVQDCCKAIHYVSLNGDLDEKYNIGSSQEHNNNKIVHKILDIMNADKSLITYVEDRKGHDKKYSISVEKTRNLGWDPNSCKSLDDGLRETVEWYKANRWFWE